MSLPEFNEQEFSFMSNGDLLVQKRVIQDKLFTLLELTQNQLSKVLDESITKHFPAGKISRGENYLSLPYLILDYPALFSLDNILACRTMFLWGHFFSTTVHLQGRYLDQNREQLIEIINVIDTKDTFISQGETPWQYHYEQDNYLPISEKAVAEALKKGFVKISKKIAIDDYLLLPEMATVFYQPFLTTMKI